MLLLQLSNRAYIKSSTKFLETLFLFNLFVISIAVTNSRSLISKDNYFIVAYVSLSVVFVLFIAMTAVHTCGNRLSKTYATVRMRFANRILQQEEREQLVEAINGETADDQLREPALIPVQSEDYNIPDPLHPL